MNENLIIFDSVIFNKKNKEFEILNGTKGLYSYKEIKKCMILAEEAKYIGKSSPFSHAIMPGGYVITPKLVQPKVYIGLKVTMKNKDILAIYTSKKETTENSIDYMKDKKEAENIKEICDKIIKKYKDV